MRQSIVSKAISFSLKFSLKWHNFHHKDWPLICLNIYLCLEHLNYIMNNIANPIPMRYHNLGNFTLLKIFFLVRGGFKYMPEKVIFNIQDVEICKKKYLLIFFCIA